MCRSSSGPGPPTTLPPGVHPAGLQLHSSLNDSGFCNRKLDPEMRQAQSLQPTDPRAADAQWAHIDREVVNAAPWIPYLNGRALDLVSKRVGNFQLHPSGDSCSTSSGFAEARLSRHAAVALACGDRMPCRETDLRPPPSRAHSRDLRLHAIIGRLAKLSSAEATIWSTAGQPRHSRTLLSAGANR